MNHTHTQKDTHTHTHTHNDKKISNIKDRLGVKQAKVNNTLRKSDE